MVLPRLGALYTACMDCQLRTLQSRRNAVGGAGEAVTFVASGTLMLGAQLMFFNLWSELNSTGKKYVFDAACPLE